ncbi:MAG TPA: thermonuclease family protein [Candidatus Paceibacterota bacterium]|nr:thermonuclease family protein [Candidatus Paceibacterota bacterium]
MNVKELKRVLIIIVVIFISFSVFVFKTDVNKGAVKKINNPQEANLSQVLKSKKDQEFEITKVTKVIDGDSFVAENGEEVRLIGVDAPEYSQPYSKEAVNFLKGLILNEEVKLEKDIRNRDRYGRLLRYVYLEDMFVNLELVRFGYANIYSYPPDVKYQDQIIEAEKKAKQAEAGFWGIDLQND